MPDEILHATLSPTGKRVLLEAHGEILSAPVEKGDVRNLTQTPAIADRDPAWSPDGKWIAWLSDRTGEYALYFMSPDGLGPLHVVDLGQPPSFYFAPHWSPDSTRIVLADKRLNLWLVDLDHPRAIKVDSDRYDTPLAELRSGVVARFAVGRLPQAAAESSPRRVPAYSVADKQTHQLTDGCS